MFLNKIKAGASGILTYGITPPKSGTDPQRVSAIANKTIERLKGLDLDALIVYDVQDEAGRTSEERPFPFLNALDPCEFASAHLNELKVPKIIYRPAGKFSKKELSTWLKNLQKNDFHPVFVGVPSPNFPVKTTLPEAYQLWKKHSSNSAIGAVTIPERHARLKDEDKRILDKASQGVSYFISQCVFNIDYTKQMVNDLRRTCEQQNTPIPTIIFTLTACGCSKTLKFMEWLGIHIPDSTKDQLIAAENMLEHSVDICLEIATSLIAFCKEQSITFGFNVESVAIRKDEIEASIRLFNTIAQMLEAEGLRKKDVPEPAKPAKILGLYFSKVRTGSDGGEQWEVIELER